MQGKHTRAIGRATQKHCVKPGSKRICTGKERRRNAGALFINEKRKRKKV